MRYTNGEFSVGDPIEVLLYSVRNLRGDLKKQWTPATVVGVHPNLCVAFNDGSRMDLRPDSEYRVPEWRNLRCA